MFRIRRIYDLTMPRNIEAMKQVQAIMRKQLAYLPEEVIEELPNKITDPFEEEFVGLLLVAESANRTIKGFAFLSLDPKLRFGFLDYIAAAGSGSGLGGVLYETVRQECLAAECEGLFFECLPDDPALVVDKTLLKDSVQRLKFYERYRARPIINTLYHQPTSPEADNATFLMFDDLDQGEPLRAERARQIVRSILERKYKGLRTPEYIQKVVDSIQDDPVKLRDPKYVQESPTIPLKNTVPPSQKIILVVNSQHAIHHVRMRVHAESPVRVKKVLEELRKTDLFQEVDPWTFPEKYIRAVHDGDYVSYLKKMSEKLKENETVFPYVFPLRNPHRRPAELGDQVGYYCVDTITPISRNAILAARSAVDCTLTAAESIMDGCKLSYALVRPPGHHAERDTFGGYCYFNNAAIAANFLTQLGKVAILDIDYHHGNGQQDIFYQRADVLTVSIHCHPRFTYPYFAGFEGETGEGPGKGFNLNITLPENEIDGERYRVALVRALKRIANFKPRVLIVALGVDTAKGDPTGSWKLLPKDFELNGRLIGQLRLPTLIVQEGGYRISHLGKNVLSFLRGIWTTTHAPSNETIPLPTTQDSGKNTPTSTVTTPETEPIIEQPLAPAPPKEDIASS